MTYLKVDPRDTAREEHENDNAKVLQGSEAEQVPASTGIHKGALLRALRAGGSLTMVFGVVLAAMAWQHSATVEGDHWKRLTPSLADEAIASEEQFQEKFAALSESEADELVAAPERKLQSRAQQEADSAVVAKESQTASEYLHDTYWAANLAVFGQRHASVHLRYYKPIPNKKITAWFMFLEPKEAGDDTYFQALATYYGYFGMQQVRSSPWNEGRVVFSMWDKCGGYAKHRWCGKGVRCTGFGGEGEGRKSIIDFSEWSVNKQYGFLLKHRKIGWRAVQQEGYFYAEELKGWILMAKIRLTRKDLSKDWAIFGMDSFVEQWTTRDFEANRWTRFGLSYMRYEGEPANSWRQVREALFTEKVNNGEVSNGNAKLDGPGNTQWGMGIGEQVGRDKTVKAPFNLKVSQVDTVPDVLQEFVSLEQRGLLPKGCLGGTCWSSFGSIFYNWCTSASRFPKLASISIICLIGLIIVCVFTYNHWKELHPTPTPYNSLGASPGGPMMSNGRMMPPGSPPRPPGSPMRR